MIQLPVPCYLETQYAPLEFFCKNSPGNTAFVFQRPLQNYKGDDGNLASKHPHCITNGHTYMYLGEKYEA